MTVTVHKTIIAADDKNFESVKNNCRNIGDPSTRKCGYQDFSILPLRKNEIVPFSNCVAVLPIIPVTKNNISIINLLHDQ